MIDIKMKLADAEEVTAAMVVAVRDSQWFAGGSHHQFAPNLVRDINLALANLGCVIIQVDAEAASKRLEGMTT